MRTEHLRYGSTSQCSLFSTVSRWPNVLQPNSPPPPPITKGADGCRLHNPVFPWATYPWSQYVTRARRSHGARSLRASCHLSRTHPFLSIDAVLVLTPARGVRPTASATLLTVGLHGWSSPSHPPSLGPAGYAMWYLLALPSVSGDPHA